jgi:hypothetical protein
VVLGLKKVWGFVLAAFLLVSLLCGIGLAGRAGANFSLPDLPEIIIQADGSVVSEVGLVSRSGEVYTLTGDVVGFGVRILRSNIVFDGAGHSIDAIGSSTAGVHLFNVTGVTVKNVQTCGGYTGIKLSLSSHCIITDCILTDVKAQSRIFLAGASNYNTITNNDVATLDISGGHNNLVIKNNIWTELFVSGSGNRFYLNNFFLADFPGIYHDNVWDDGVVGNYWNHYLVKYPNALELDGLGVGDTPYVIERNGYSARESPDAVNVDFFPLMFPFGSPKLSMLGVENATCIGDFPLSFTVDGVVGRLCYSLNGGANVTCTGNTTITGLAPGSYNLTVYAAGEAGLESSKTTSFTIAELPAGFEAGLFIPAIAIAAVAILTAGAVCLLYYRKKHKRKLFPRDNQ